MNVDVRTPRNGMQGTDDERWTREDGGEDNHGKSINYEIIKIFCKLTFDFNE